MICNVLDFGGKGLSIKNVSAKSKKSTHSLVEASNSSIEIRASNSLLMLSSMKAKARYECRKGTTSRDLLA